jgi:KDO2-lipid IV(A) lauroyltransferase
MGNKKEIRREVPVLIKRFINFLLPALVRVVYYLSLLLPEKVFIEIFRKLSSFYFRLVTRYRRKIRDNLGIAFGASLEDQEIERFTNAVAENVGTHFAETVITTTSKQERVLAKIGIEGVENLEKALSRGKGVVAVSAHLGHFTILSLKMIRAGYPFNMLIRDPDSKAIVRIFRKLQKQQGGHFIPINQWREALRKILGSLRKNEVVCFLSDERKKGSDVEVDFFGHTALTATGPAVIALKTGAPIVPIFIVRTGEDSHTIFIEPQLPVNHRGTITDTVTTVIAACTKMIEKYVRKYPEQWFWFKNRWSRV